jgi:hypothetical protein
MEFYRQDNIGVDPAAGGMLPLIAEKTAKGCTGFGLGMTIVASFAV